MVNIIKYVKNCYLTVKVWKIVLQVCSLIVFHFISLKGFRKHDIILTLSTLGKIFCR